jgi:hypothetical protein
MSQVRNGSLPKPIISVISLHLHISFSYAVAKSLKTECIRPQTRSGLRRTKSASPGRPKACPPVVGLPA